MLPSAFVDSLDRHLADRGTEGAASGPVVALDLAADDRARRLATDSRLVTLADAIVGVRTEPFGFTYLVKPPSSETSSAWHQDGHPWSADGSVPAAVTLWVPLDPATVGSGGLRVVPGSHRGALHALEPLGDPEADDLFGWRTPPHLVDEAGAVDLSLSAGDVSAHHPSVLHGSGPNRSTRRRAALAVRYRAVRS